MATTEFQVPARDGASLAATGYGASRPVGKQAVVIAGTAGESRRLYAAFADHLARAGYPVLTFDYRGSGDSLTGPIKSSAATLRQWSEQDLAGVLDWAARAYPGMDLVLIGHAVGGQLLALLPDNGAISAFIGISAASGEVSLRSGVSRLRGWARAQGMAVAARSYGYLPGGRFGVAEALPKEVALEWSRWSLANGYLFEEYGRMAEQRAANMRAPTLAVVIGDDPAAPRAAVEELMRRFSPSALTYLTVRPEDYGAPSIGGRGFFGAEFSETLWRPIVAWIEALAPEAGAAPASADFPGELPPD